MKDWTHYIKAEPGAKQAVSPLYGLCKKLTWLMEVVWYVGWGAQILCNDIEVSLVLGDGRLQRKRRGGSLSGHTPLEAL